MLESPVQRMTQSSRRELNKKIKNQKSKSKKQKAKKKNGRKERFIEEGKTGNSNKIREQRKMRG